MRRQNLARVLHALADHGPQSRAEAAARIGLTRAAVSTLVEELMRAGLLVEQGPGRSGTVGRPGTVLQLADRGPCGLAAEIGVDHLAACAMDLRGTIRARGRCDINGRSGGPGPVLGRLTTLLEEVAREAADQGLRPERLTVAVPGLVTRGGTTVVRAPNLGWRDTDLAARLPAALGVLAVDNEANLGALAELWTDRPELPGSTLDQAPDVRGAATSGGPGGPGGPGGSGPTAAADPAGTGPAVPHAPGGDSFVHVSAEIGIGAAVVIDGQLLRGAHGFAGELGHVPVRPDGRPCTCGGRGCLETYAGEEAVLRAAGLEPGPGVRIDDLASRCAAGDQRTLRAVRRAGTALGIALSGAVNLLDPGRVVIGGALARLGPWLLPPLDRELARRTAVASGGRPTPVEVRASRLGPDGPLLGAARTSVRALLDMPVRPAAA
nr:ROK family transcriptional regulator [Streptomyces aidingensis]